MRKIKLTLFYITMTPVIVVSLVLGCLASFLIAVGSVLCGIYEVVRNISFRYEMWANSCPRGSFHNCPWKTTLWDEFVNTVKHFNR